MATQPTRFDYQFTYEEIKSKLSGLNSSSVYSFTKRHNREEFENLMTLLPNSYVNDLRDDIESIDLIYSGSSQAPFLLTLAVGRNDKFHGKETYDIDVLNIAPETENTASYFSQQWHHFKDENGKRTSYEIHPVLISDEERKKDLTYGSFLTGSTIYNSFEEYQKHKPKFYDIHIKSFGDLDY